jgi:hypothetical protein
MIAAPPPYAGDRRDVVHGVPPSPVVLDKQLSNPVAALISVPFQYNYDEKQGPNQDGRKNYVNFQPVVPITLNDEWNVISRTILPIIDQQNVNPTDNHQSGIGDVTQSFFFSPVKPTESGWIWGVGPVFLVPTASDKTIGGFASS